MVKECRESCQRNFKNKLLEAYDEDLLQHKKNNKQIYFELGNDELTTKIVKNY